MKNGRHLIVEYFLCGEKKRTRRPSFSVFLRSRKNQIWNTDYIRLSKKHARKHWMSLKRKLFNIISWHLLSSQNRLFWSKYQLYNRNVFDHFAYEARYLCLLLSLKQWYLSKIDKNYWNIIIRLLVLEKETVTQSEVPFDYISFMDSSIFEK